MLEHSLAKLAYRVGYFHTIAYSLTLGGVLAYWFFNEAIFYLRVRHNFSQTYPNKLGMLDRSTFRTKISFSSSKIIALHDS